MKIIVICPRFPYPLEKGDKLRIYHQLKILSQRGYEIHLVALTEESPSTVSIKKIEALVEKLHIIKISKIKRYASILRHAFSSIPFQVAYYYSNSTKREIDKLIADVQPDHIYCQLPRSAHYLRGINYSKTIDYMDAFGVGMSRRAEVVSGVMKLIYQVEAKRMIQYEQDIYSSFDQHTIISKQDATLLGNNITVVPNGIDAHYFSPLKKEKEYKIGFIGNMGYAPNINASEYLVNEILFGLPKNYNCVLAGARPDKRVSSLASEQVTVTGWIEDIRHAYASIEVFVAPLWKGTGQQNKILEAMAMGIPCITTSTVNEAIGAKIDHSILVADNLEAYISAINKLLTDTSFYSKIRENALNFVRENYSWESSVDILEACFQYQLK